MEDRLKDSNQCWIGVPVEVNGVWKIRKNWRNDRWKFSGKTYMSFQIKIVLSVSSSSSFSMNLRLWLKHGNKTAGHWAQRENLAVDWVIWGEPVLHYGYGSRVWDWKPKMKVAGNSSFTGISYSHTICSILKDQSDMQFYGEPPFKMYLNYSCKFTCHWSEYQPSGWEAG